MDVRTYFITFEKAGILQEGKGSKMQEVILGIDPGTLVMGYGLITVDGRKARLLEMGILKLSAKEDHAERLLMIYNKMDTLMKLHRPAAVAIEAPFFGKNVQSMLKLGRAQGVAIAVSMAHGVQATEYAPRKVKQAITGMGNASKEQVWRLLQSTLDFTEQPKYMDATDAVAVALCHHYERSSPLANQPIVKKTLKKNNNSWEGFITANPDRVK